MVLLSIFFTNRIHGGIINELFFIHFVAPCACSSSSGLKYYFKSFCMKIWARCTHTSVGCISLRILNRTALCYATNAISENISNIWHKSSTKHKEVRPDWNDKNDNANYAPSYHMEGFTNGWTFFKSIRSSAKDLDCELFYSELKACNVSHYVLSSHR